MAGLSVAQREGMVKLKLKLYSPPAGTTLPIVGKVRVSQVTMGASLLTTEPST
jgi:hypothetical protein